METEIRKNGNTQDGKRFPKEFDESQQELFLQAMITHKWIYDRCEPILRVEYFDRILRNTAKYIFENLSRNIIPIPEQIKAQGDREIKLLESELSTDAAKLMLEEIEKFCKRKAAEYLLLDGHDLLRNNNYQLIEERAKAINSMSTNPQIGYSCRRDFSTLLRQSVDQGLISTGWKSVDDILYGGLQRNGLTIFGGQSGSCKSNCIINLGLNLQSAGLNVIYITLEMAERVINQRWAAMITGMSTNEIRSDINRAELKIATLLKGGYGDIFYIKLPEGQTSVSDIRTHLRMIMAHHGITPDVVICDYIDLLCPSKRMDMSNLFVKDKYVAEELRAMAFEFGTSVVTASQLNRGSYEDGNFDLSHTAGGMSKINTADDVIFIKCSPEMKQQGRIEFQFLKTRNSAGVGKKLMMKYAPECMRISDAEQVDMPKSRNPVIGKLLKNGH